MTQILDMNGVPRDEAWLYQKYGIQIVRATGAHFALTTLQETGGTMIHQIHVQDANGMPLPAHAVAMHWDGAKTDLTKEDTAAFKTRYSSPADVQWTDASGNTGFELGPGGFSGGAGGGPHDDWILHHLYPSDVLAKHGWKAMTNHEQMGRVTFTLVMGTPVPPPDPDPEPVPDDGSVVALLTEIRNLIKAGFRL